MDSNIAPTNPASFQPARSGVKHRGSAIPYPAVFLDHDAPNGSAATPVPPRNSGEEPLRGKPTATDTQDRKEKRKEEGAAHVVPPLEDENRLHVLVHPIASHLMTALRLHTGTAERYRFYCQQLLQFPRIRSDSNIAHPPQAD